MASFFCAISKLRWKKGKGKEAISFHLKVFMSKLGEHFGHFNSI